MEPPDPLWRVSEVRTPADATREEVAALYARSCPRLIGVLTAICGSRSEAEEVAQEAYLKLLLQWSKIRTYDDPESWVRIVAVRMLISRHRRAKVAIVNLRRLAGRVQQQPEPNADAVAIAAALRTLPVSQRAVVILHYVLDQPVEQVSSELQVPVGTVKSRLSRARAALAPLLRENEEANRV